MSVELLSDHAVLESHVTVDHADLVELSIDELIIGRPLAFPLFDDSGVLLLAEGNTITPEFKRLLKQRGQGSVQVHHEDAAKNAFSQISQTPVEATMSLDTELASQLDKVIDSGLLFVKNSGPAMRQSMVLHGCRAYNLDRHQDLQDQRVATCESLDNMMKEAVRGQAVSSTVVTNLAAQYLADMAEDSDCVLSVAMQATQDPALSDHCLKMATLGMAIGVEMGLDEDNCKRICVAGLMHDWGMARVPAEIRNATRILSASEFFQIKKHPIFTAEMLERMPGVPSMVPIVVYQVHERPNGLGYPRGRAGDRIHIFARILAVADIYSALTEPRAYRRPLAPYAAMECLVRMAKSRDVDPEVVRALLKVMSLFPIGSYVTLSDGSVARVIRRNPENYSSPIVQLVQDSGGNAVPADAESAISDLAASSISIIQALPTPGRQETLLTEDVLHQKRPK
jgi:HD-GYP domain-containing protein (c-di-GMP phosphodiesterase class II)